jgi:hypothetical protein
MRTAVIIACGMVLWAACLGAAKFASGSASAFTQATIGFVILWFIGAAANMWLGVTRAGYAVSEELPIFLLIFLTPVLVASVVRWKWL